jgi:hypothetical protein
MKTQSEYLRWLNTVFKKKGKFTIYMRIFGQLLLVDKQKTSSATAVAMATITFQNGGYFGFKVI